ncbi:EpsG family protein [Aeromonas media]|uniref:EpsG family protein n=3 Tax=Aeromonas media TaxID=651 RepID=UPI0024C16AD2|nr:EpsG family protein [Aeromonas media]MDM5076658.1 EpsG family protein [Aeromonas media]
MYLSDSYLLGFNAIIIASMTMLAFLYAFNNVSNPQRSLNEFLVLLFFVFILIAFRTRGWDVEQYYNAYNGIDGEVLDFDSWFEPGFLFLNFIFKYMDAPYFIFNTVVSLILTTLIFLATKDNVRNAYIFLFLLVLFYFFRGPYGQVRQAISILAFMVSVKYLLPERRSLFKYFSINAIAFTFHSVSIVSIIVPFVSYIWISRRLIYWLSLLFLIIIFSLMMFSSNIGAILSYLGDIPYLKKVYIYVTNFSASGNVFNPDTTRIIFCFLIMMFAPEGFYDRESPFAKINNLHRVVFALGSLLYALLVFDFRMASRIASFFYVFDIFIYTNCIFLVRDLTKRMLLFSIVTVVGIIYLVYEFYMMSVGEIKYQWGF